MLSTMKRETTKTTKTPQMTAMFILIMSKAKISKRKKRTTMILM